MLTAMALFASASLVLGRPQDRLQTRDFTDDLIVNLGASPKGVTIPSPEDFMPSSPDGGSPSSIGIPNLGFSVPGALSALPQAPATIGPFGSTGLPTDYTNTLSPSGDGASEMAITVKPPPEKHVDLQTDAVIRTIDSVNSGQFAYAILESGHDRKSLVPAFMSNQYDWNAFALFVQTVPPSYVLRSIPDGILFIFTYQFDVDFIYPETPFLNDNFQKFFKVVRDRCGGKAVYGAQVHDDASLKDAIDSHSQAAPVGLPGHGLDI